MTRKDHTAPEMNRAEDDLRTLVQEREIHKDPKRFKAAQRLARKRLSDMKKITARRQQ